MIKGIAVKHPTAFHKIRLLRLLELKDVWTPLLPIRYYGISISKQVQSRPREADQRATCSTVATSILTESAVFDPCTLEEVLT